MGKKLLLLELRNMAMVAICFVLLGIASSSLELTRYISVMSALYSINKRALIANLNLESVGINFTLERNITLAISFGYTNLRG